MRGGGEPERLGAPWGISYRGGGIDESSKRCQSVIWVVIQGINIILSRRINNGGSKNTRYQCSST